MKKLRHCHPMYAACTFAQGVFDTYVQGRNKKTESFATSEPQKCQYTLARNFDKR